MTLTIRNKQPPLHPLCLSHHHQHHWRQLRLANNRQDGSISRNTLRCATTSEVSLQSSVTISISQTDSNFFLSNKDLTPLRETIAEQNNGDNYRPTNGDQSELAKLEELLEALSMSLATVPPPQPPNEREQIHRSGRTYLLGDRQQQHQQQVAGFELSPAYIQSPVAEAPSSAAYNRYTTIQQQQARRQSPAEQSRQHQQAVAEGLAAISSGGSLLWPQSARSMSSERALSNDRANARRSPTNPRLTSDSAEVVIHTPLHSSRSVSDYEWKRVENSRWNNLRGMWGKRSVPPGAGADESSRGAPRSNDNDSGDGDGTYLRQQAEQHPKKRSQTLVAANGNFM